MASENRSGNALAGCTEMTSTWTQRRRIGLFNRRDVMVEKGYRFPNRRSTRGFTRKVCWPPWKRAGALSRSAEGSAVLQRMCCILTGSRSYRNSPMTRARRKVEPRNLSGRLSGSLSENRRHPTNSAFRNEQLDPHLSGMSGFCGRREVPRIWFCANQPGNRTKPIHYIGLE